IPQRSKVEAAVGGDAHSAGVVVRVVVIITLAVWLVEWPASKHAFLVHPMNHHLSISHSLLYSLHHLRHRSPNRQRRRRNHSAPPRPPQPPNRINISSNFQTDF